MNISRKITFSHKKLFSVIKKTHVLSIIYFWSPSSEELMLFSQKRPQWFFFYSLHDVSPFCQKSFEFQEIMQEENSLLDIKPIFVAHFTSGTCLTGLGSLGNSYRENTDLEIFLTKLLYKRSDLTGWKSKMHYPKMS